MILTFSKKSISVNQFRPIVTVMMPFHNAVSTIERALGSVCTQTYRPLQVVLVDDGSTDASADRVKALIEQYESDSLKFILLTTNNYGVGAARKLALEQAEGEYITAVDADDYADPVAIETYVNATQQGKIDIVAAGVYYDYGTRQVPMLFKPGERLDLDEIRIDSLHFLLTNKLIRVSALREVEPFTPGENCWEDLGAISRMLALGYRTTILPGAYYHYVQNTSGSLTGSASDYILEQHIRVTKSLEQWLRLYGLHTDYEDFLRYLKFIAKVKFMRPVRKVLRHPVRQLRGWSTTFPEANHRIIHHRHVPLHYRLLFTAAYFASHLLPRKQS